MTGVDGQPIVFDSQEQAIASPIFQRYKNSSQIEDYQSGHFDEPNILAHMRVNDRMIDGKKSLFVEEIQSDWHQAGRKKGYSTQEGKERKSEIRVELHGLQSELSRLRAQKNVVSVQEEPQINARLEEVDKKITDLRYELGSIGDVPDAPYKKNWQEMAMRRAIQMAVDEGYDRVAFTTGKQQAERYSLSKQIDALNLKPALEGDKKFVLEAWKDGRNVIRRAVNEDELADYVGKEPAQKLIDAQPNEQGAKELKGLELDVGGEGMKGFYDKILPEYVNKYGKKYGIKVGKTNLPSNQNFESWAVKKYPELNSTFINDAYVRQGDLWNEYLSDIKANPPKGDEIHYFDITPEAKKSLLEKGSPLFAIPPAVEMTDEESRKEMLERLFKENQK
jgi:hypothetical protein